MANEFIPGLTRGQVSQAIGYLTKEYNEVLRKPGEAIQQIPNLGEVVSLARSNDARCLGMDMASGLLKSAGDKHAGTVWQYAAQLQVARALAHGLERWSAETFNSPPGEQLLDAVAQLEKSRDTVIQGFVEMRDVTFRSFKGQWLKLSAQIGPQSGQDRRAGTAGELRSSVARWRDVLTGRGAQSESQAHDTLRNCINSLDFFFERAVPVLQPSLGWSAMEVRAEQLLKRIYAPPPTYQENAATPQRRPGSRALNDSQPSSHRREGADIARGSRRGP